MKKTKLTRIKLRKESVRLLQAAVTSEVVGGKISNGVMFDCCTTNSLIVDTTVTFHFGCPD